MRRRTIALKKPRSPQYKRPGANRRYVLGARPAIRDKIERIPIAHHIDRCFRAAGDEEHREILGTFGKRHRRHDRNAAVGFDEVECLRNDIHLSPGQHSKEILRYQ